MYNKLAKGQSSMSLQEGQEEQKVKGSNSYIKLTFIEKLNSVQNELLELQLKLKKAKEAAAEKERAKRRLENQVARLKTQVSTEQRTNSEQEAEFKRKEESLKLKIQEASGFLYSKLI